MKRVLLLLCNGVELYEAAAFYDVLGWSGTDGDERVEVVTVGLTPTVRCTFGLHITPQQTLSNVDVKTFDALAVPGGFGTEGFYDEAYSQAVSDLIRDFNSHAKPISSICVGALALGKSGVLTDRKATTYHLGGGHRRKQLAEFGVNVIDQPLVLDRNVVTSTSPATAMDVAFQLLTDLTTESNSRKVRLAMGFS